MTSTPVEPITSVQNPRVKDAVQLHQRKFRETSQRILIEGRHPVEEAMAAGVAIKAIFIRPGETIPEVDCPVYEGTDQVMTKISTTDSASPIVAIASKPVSDSNKTLRTAKRMLGLVQIQDPGNVGTLIRSACAFGIDAVVTIGSSVDFYNPKIIRSSAGLVFRIPLADVPDLSLLSGALPEDCTLYGADAHQGVPYHQVDYSGNWMILLGTEAHGLPEEIWKSAQAVHIPISGTAESLNVAIAGSILMAEQFHKTASSAAPLTPAV